MSDDSIPRIYITSEMIEGIHRDIIENDPGASEGVINLGQVDFAVRYVEDGYFGETPETIHEEAVHLMRLLAAGHPFADGNKRTALNATWTFYLRNGIYFDYGEEIKAILKLFAVMERMVDVDEVVGYFSEITRPLRESDVPDELYDMVGKSELFVHRMQEASEILEDEIFDKIQEADKIEIVSSEDEWRVVSENMDMSKKDIGKLREFHQIYMEIDDILDDLGEFSSDFWEAMDRIEEMAGLAGFIVECTEKISEVEDEGDAEEFVNWAKSQDVAKVTGVEYEEIDDPE